jgi:DNA-binding HxlR family transcriptional regulator
MKIRDDYTCPLEIVHDIIKGKWKTIILFQLRNGPASLSALEKGIEGSGEKILRAIRIMQEIGVEYMAEHPQKSG